MDVKELLPEVDIEDPSCLDKILIKLDDIMIEDDEFMQILVQKVGHKVKYWHQPWYQQKGSITRPIKEEEGEQEYRVDSITSEEKEIIEKNWEKFILKYKIPDKLVCLARWRSTVRNHRSAEDKARHFAISFLARGLQRTLYHVFRYIVRHYGFPVKHTSYSKDEEKVMQIILYHNPQNASIIASKLLQREPRGVSKKLNELLNGKNEFPRLKWDLSLLTKFIKLLMEYNEVENLEDLKNQSIKKSVWVKLQDEMGQNYIFLQRYWYAYLHVQLFVKRPVYLRKVRRNVFKKLKKSSYKMWSDIRWKELISQFPDGFTHLFLYKISHSVLRARKDILTTPLPILVEYALDRLKEIKSNKRMRNLMLNDSGVLEVFRFQEVDNGH